jgi:hypothetical protein
VYVDVVLQRAALSVRIARGESPRPLAGLVVDDDEIGALLAELPGLIAPDDAALDRLAGATDDQIDRALNALLEPDEMGPFDAIAFNADLDPPSVTVLAVAVAIELHPARQLLVAYLNDDVSRRWLSPAAIGRMLGSRAVRALGSDEPLARCCLVSITGDGPWSLRPVQAAPTLVAALGGAPGRDADLPRDARVVEIADSDGDQFVLVHGGDALARVELATESTSGSRFLVTRSPATDSEWEAVVRQCVIGGMSMVIDLGSSIELTESERWWIDRTRSLPLAVCSQEEIRLDTLPERSFRERRAVRRLREVGAHIVDGTQAALIEKAMASLDGDADASVRRLVTGNLETHAGRTTPGRRWEELVLPPHHIQVLHELVARYRHRRTVYHDWAFPARPSTGVTALFAGPSGTGKTMTAEVIASSLGLDLYRIDLSAVVSKYIGETEKNLEDIFTASAAGNLVLFFDEADALFGKRSEVGDAHDRYANIEVAYLLQRLERYDGFVVLATNMRNNIDAAFLRRIDLVLEFEIPDVDQRRAIWEGIFPAVAPIGPLDLSSLAEQFDVTGGTIRNAAVHAAFLAADAGTVITMDHVLLGMSREFQKMGRLRVNLDEQRAERREVAHAASA